MSLTKRCSEESMQMIENDQMIELSDSEIEEARKMFYRNCNDAARHLANVSSDNLSQMQLKASIDGNEVDRFILIQARQLKKDFEEMMKGK